MFFGCVFFFFFFFFLGVCVFGGGGVFVGAFLYCTKREQQTGLFSISV